MGFYKKYNTYGEVDKMIEAKAEGTNYFKTNEMDYNDQRKRHS